jgi:hypothetical protein
LYGEKDDKSKWFRCWNCGAICDVTREKLDQGEYGKGGSNPICNLSLLLHMEGNNGSTTFTDSSPTGNTVTANGNAQISTALYKFGSSSALFDGTGDYLTIADSSAFDLSGGYWSIEGWIRRTTWVFPSANGIFFQKTDANNYFSIYTFDEEPPTTCGLALSIYSGGSEVVSVSTSHSAVKLNEWHHFEVNEWLNSYRIFIDGVQVASVNDANRPANYTGTVYIGYAVEAGLPGRYFNGNIDELMVIKHVDHLQHFDVKTAAYNEDGLISGAYKSDVSSGCWFCGSTNYK